MFDLNQRKDEGATSPGVGKTLGSVCVCVCVRIEFVPGPVKCEMPNTHPSKGGKGTRESGV